MRHSYFLYGPDLPKVLRQEWSIERVYLIFNTGKQEAYRWEKKSDGRGSDLPPNF